MEKVERISQERLEAGLNKAARAGEKYYVEVMPMTRPPQVSVMMERQGEVGETRHAIVFYPDRPSHDDTKLTPAEIRAARDALERWANMQGGLVK